MFIETLEKSGVFILILLSFYFYNQNKKEKRANAFKIKKNTSLFKGIILSTLNVFAIPFFGGIAVLLMNYNLMNLDSSSIFCFVFGSVIGVYFILFLYGRYADKIQKKSVRFTKNINLFLSIITATFALFTLIKFAI